MNYELNNDTLVIIPNGKKGSKIVEDKRVLLLEKSTMRVIEQSCEYYGVCYRSRLEGATNFIKSRYKVPIVVSEVTKMIFFPVSAVTKEENLWINYNNIVDYSKTNDKQVTLVKFKNGFKLKVNVSYYSFNNQYLKASKIYSMLSKIH